MLQPNRKIPNVAPYRVYTLPEFYRLASIGMWPGANVEGFGYLYQGRSVPKYISIYLSKGTTAQEQKKATIYDDINQGLLVAGIASGGTEFGKLGSMRWQYKGVFNPGYYKYRASLGSGWRGGTSAMIETTQISGKTGYGNMAGRYVAWAGIGINGLIALDAYKHHKKQVLKKALADMVMTRVGMMGLPGFIIGTAYFLIDPFDPDKKSSEMENEEISPIDNLKVNKKFMTLEEQKEMEIRRLNRIERPIIKRKF